MYNKHTIGEHMYRKLLSPVYLEKRHTWVQYGGFSSSPARRQMSSSAYLWKPEIDALHTDVSKTCLKVKVL